MKIRFFREGSSYLLDCRRVHFFTAFAEVCTSELGCTLICTIAKTFKARLALFVLSGAGAVFSVECAAVWGNGFRRVSLSVTVRMHQPNRIMPI